MSAEEFESIRAALALSRAALARLLVRDPKTVERYALGLHPVPMVVARKMRELISEKHN